MPKLVEATVVAMPGRVAASSKSRRNRIRRHQFRGEASGTTRGSGWVRSDTDEQVLAVAGRFGALMARQARDWHYDGVDPTARRRITYMQQAGLLYTTRNLRWSGPVMWPSPAGMRAAELHSGLAPLMSTAMPSEAEMAHRLLVVDWALRSARNREFDQIISEREFRQVERNPDPQVVARYAQQAGITSTTGLRGPDGRPRWFGIPVTSTAKESGNLHWPDAYAVTSGLLVAVEIELTAKMNERTLAVLRGYRRAYEQGHIAAVHWWVTDEVRTQIEGFLDGDRRWQDGLLAQAGIVPKGARPDYTAPGTWLHLADVRSRDEGLQYICDRAQLPPDLRRDMPTWKLWRAAYQASDSAANHHTFTTWATLNRRHLDDLAANTTNLGRTRVATN